MIMYMVVTIALDNGSLSFYICEQQGSREAREMCADNVGSNVDI